MNITRDSLVETMKSYVRRYDRRPNEVRLNRNHLADVLSLCRKGMSTRTARVIRAQSAFMGMTYVVDDTVKRLSMRFNPIREMDPLYQELIKVKEECSG